MTEKFEGGPKGPEKPKDYSPEEMQKIHQLTIKVRDLIGWDLGSMCSDSEEIQIVNEAKDAMKEDETDLNVVKNARQAFAELKKCLNKACDII